MNQVCNFKRWMAVWVSVPLWLVAGGAHAETTRLADQPIRATIAAPANVLLTPSVEFPTAVSYAHIDSSFNSAKRYEGYFDPIKCYEYKADPDVTGANYFDPVGFTASDYSCSGAWSGNFLNWATMQGIDMFRWALTGGARDVDKPVTFADSSDPRTVVKRAYASGQGGASNFPNRYVSSSVLAKYAASPVNTSKSGTLVNAGQGTQLKIEQSSGNKYVDIRVQVCKVLPGNDLSYLESNCKAYRDSASTRVVYRPEGLMQENKDSMRFGTFGYLLEADLYRDGGVLRGKMTDISSELSATGAFLLNPAPADATASGVSSSGVMNYLNYFGFASKNYKTYDPVGELYAEALRYFKGYSGPTDGYATNLDATKKDGFPVITDWDDPILYACQKNFILGIGDVNTHADRNLAGVTTDKSKEPSTPSNLDTAWNPDTGTGAGSTATDLVGWTNIVGNFEGITSLGLKTNYPTCCNNNGPLMAGAAYWAHTQDIRPGANANEVGKQTVTTFWVDVLEYGTYRDHNQFWLAAKYGGFSDENENDAFDSGDIWNAKGRKYNTYDLPDNYFPSSEGSQMVEGLKSAFDQINNLIASGAGVGLASSSISTSITESSVYGVSYDSDDWSGSIKGYQITAIDATDGTLTLDQRWDVADKLAVQNWDTGRVIVTGKWGLDVDGNPVFNGARAFRWDQFSATEQAAYFGSDADMLKFLRGDRTYETTDSIYNKFRQRGSVLGDVVNSEATFVGKPSAEYSDAFNPGYAAFKAKYAARTEMIYVGANDGMLHAVYADTTDSLTSNGGKERWAYIPSFLLDGPDGSPATSGLWALSKNDFVHHYYVDATPVVRDVDFDKTNQAMLDAAAIAESSGTEATATPDWRTVLVGGLGKGGRGFYAIDVTDPTDMTSETAVAGKVLWEFTDEDMGYSYGRPLITKTRKWGWVVVLTGGYNNVLGTTVDNRGKGVLYVLDVKTGDLLQKIYTSEGTATDPSGFAQVTGYTLDYTDYTTEQVYGGDLLGNVWRFDFSDASADVPDPVQFATVKDSNDVAQPITTAPQIEYGAGDPLLRRWVFVGTGRQLDAVDSPNSQGQTFYAFRDGTRSTPNKTASDFPIVRADMKSVSYTDLTTGGVEVSSTQMGWYLDLTGRDDATRTDSASERVVINPVANDGVISWVGSIPSSDPCTPTGTARVYAVKYASASSVLYRNETDGRVVLGYITADKGLVKAQPVRQGNSIRILGTDPEGDPSLIGPGIGEPADPRVVNWRFIN